MCRSAGIFAGLVADDRTLVKGIAGRLVARSPATIAGLVELRGFGPAPAPSQPAAIVDLVVELVPAADAPRHRDDATMTLEGVTLPHLALAGHASPGTARAVLACLGLDFGAELRR
jgi:serine kinase of HPr protein (carbohydrate metabolism regulator)